MPENNTRDQAGCDISVTGNREQPTLQRLYKGQFRRAAHRRVAPAGVGVFDVVFGWCCHKRSPSNRAAADPDLAASGCFLHDEVTDFQILYAAAISIG